MSRVEENENMKEMIAAIGAKDFDNGDLAVMNTVLIDISKSLAVIADSLSKENKK